MGWVPASQGQDPAALSIGPTTDGKSQELFRSVVQRACGTGDVFFFMKLSLVPCVFVRSSEDEFYSMYLDT